MSTPKKTFQAPPIPPKVARLSQKNLKMTSKSKKKSQKTKISQNESQ